MRSRTGWRSINQMLPPELDEEDTNSDILLPTHIVTDIVNPHDF